MSGILPAEVQEFGASLGRGRSLSPRRARRIVRVRQVWVDEHGQRWTVANVHRKDGLVHLRGRVGNVPVPVSLFPSFAELGRHYRLTDEQPRGP